MGGAKNLASVLRHFRVHPVGPGQNPASEIMDLLESSLAQEVHSLGAAHTGAAVGHNFAAGVEFVDALGQIAQRDKISINVADLVLVRLADIEHENVFTGIEPTLQFLYLNFGNPRFHRFLLTTDSAKFIVVDQFGHGWMGSASRAIRILAQLELAELH